MEIPSILVADFDFGPYFHRESERHLRYAKEDLQTKRIKEVRAAGKTGQDGRPNYTFARVLSRSMQTWRIIEHVQCMQTRLHGMEGSGGVGVFSAGMDKC